MSNNRSMFGGQGIFGRSVKMVPQNSPLGQGQSLLPPQQGLQVSPLGQVQPQVQPQPQLQGPAPAAPAQKAPYNPQPASFPPKRIPMGNKGDCPICH